MLNLKEAAPRALADFAMVQAAAAGSLVGTILLHGGDPAGPGMAAVAEALEHYYAARFLPLSLLFPAVFLLNGFYTRSRAYTGRYKLIVVLRGSVAAALLFLCANFLLSREEMMPRSAVLMFGVLLSCGTAGARWAKAWLVSHTVAEPPQRARQDRQDAPVLVVGGAGYIGSVLCRRLLEKGARVRVLDSLVYGDFAIRDLAGREGFELVTGDCRDIRSVVSAMRGVKSVVHLAAIVGDGACEHDRQTALEVNYAATRMMIEIAKGNGVERFLFASSCSVYGSSDLLMDEHSAVAPISLYAHTKLDSENALLEARAPGFEPVILRLATVFGHGYRPRFDLVVNLLAAQAHHEGRITIYNGGQWRPFIHVRDVAEGMLRALDAPIEAVGGEIFNLGDSRLNHTLAEIAEMIRRRFPLAHVEIRDNADRRNYRVCFDKARHRLGFECILNVSDGIEELKGSFERQAVPDYTDPRYHNQRFLESSGGSARIDRFHSRVMAAFAGN
jgi:nucleoside-diphosphate-sugar epimerase